MMGYCIHMCLGAVWEGIGIQLGVVCKIWNSVSQTLGNAVGTFRESVGIMWACGNTHCVFRCYAAPANKAN